MRGPRTGAVLQVSQPKAENYKHDAEDERVGGYQPDQRERPRAGEEDHQEADEYGERATDTEQPFVIYVFAQLDGRHYLHYACEDGPHSYDGDQHQRRDVGPGEGDDARSYAEQPFDQQSPPSILPANSLQRGSHREHAVYQRVRAEQDHERAQGQAGPHEG